VERTEVTMNQDFLSRAESLDVLGDVVTDVFVDSRSDTVRSPTLENLATVRFSKLRPQHFLAHLCMVREWATLKHSHWPADDVPCLVEC